MKVKIELILNIIVLAVLLLSCVNPSFPVYKMTDEDGTSVYSDGVRYKELPKLKWEIDYDYSNPSNDFGYAGDTHLIISSFNLDTEKNFVVLYGFGDTFIVLYRTDKNVPDVSVDSVDKIVWIEYNENRENKDSYTNTVTNKEIITELFDLLNSEEKSYNNNQAITDSKYYYQEIILYSSDLPGVSYSLYIGMSDDGRVT